MDKVLRSHADLIVKEAIAAVQPDAAVQRALKQMTFPGRVLLVAAGSFFALMATTMMRMKRVAKKHRLTRLLLKR